MLRAEAGYLVRVLASGDALAEVVVSPAALGGESQVDELTPAPRFRVQFELSGLTGFDADRSVEISRQLRAPALAALLTADCRWPGSGLDLTGWFWVSSCDLRRFVSVRAWGGSELGFGPLLPGRYRIVAKGNGSTPRTGEGVEVLLVAGSNRVWVDATGPEPQ